MRTGSASGRGSLSQPMRWSIVSARPFKMEAKGELFTGLSPSADGAALGADVTTLRGSRQRGSRGIAPGPGAWYVRAAVTSWEGAAHGSRPETRRCRSAAEDVEGRA